MIKVDYRIPNSLRSFLGSLGAAGRHNLYSAAAAAVCNLVRRHVSAEAPKRHFSRNGVIDGPAQATGHLEKAARKTVFTADTEHGEVVIPAPGFGRAFHDVEITPDGKPYLTIPIHAQSYGAKVAQLKALGWGIFRPPAKGAKLIEGGGRRRYDSYQNLLMGSRDGDVVPLYILKQRVRQKQDRSLLPSDPEINSAAARAMVAEIQRVARKATVA